VKWLFFRLGTITIATDSIPNDPGRYKVLLTLDSNPDIFFISIHSQYEGIVGLHPVRCESFLGRERQGDDTLMTRYTFIDSLKRVVMEQWILPVDTLVKSETRDTVNRFFDGSSLIFFARTLAHSNGQYSAPTLVEMDMFTTDINFTGVSAPVEIGAVDEEIDSRELFGKANFEGKTFGGFSGEFRGWFSNDYASIPIKAEMSISLGTVTVELEEWSGGLLDQPGHCGALRYRSARVHRQTWHHAALRCMDRPLIIRRGRLIFFDRILGNARADGWNPAILGRNAACMGISPPWGFYYS